jgi:hypothetical protein
MMGMREMFSEEEIEELVAVALTHGVAVRLGNKAISDSSCNQLQELSKKLRGKFTAYPWILAALDRSNKRVTAMVTNELKDNPDNVTKNWKGVS